MAIIDSTLEMADAVSVAAVAGTALIGSQIDTSRVAPFLGAGQPVYLVISVDTAIITGGSAGTVRFKLASDDTASISTTTSTVHLQTGEFVTDDAVASPFTAGLVLFCGALPTGTFSATGNVAGTGGNVYERYLGILCVTTTTTTTAGKINAYLTTQPVEAWKAFPDATN